MSKPHFSVGKVYPAEIKIFPEWQSICYPRIGTRSAKNLQSPDAYNETHPRAAKTCTANFGPPAERSFCPLTILLVEDEGFVRSATAEILETAGYRVIPMQNAEEALQTFRSFAQPLDLLLSDVVLPGMTGYELAREFLNRFPSASVLLMTGYAEKSPGEHAAGRCIHFAKPFDATTLLKKLSELAEMPARMNQ